MTDTETQTAGSKRRHLTDREHFAVMTELTAGLERFGDGWRYKPGIGDQVIATFCKVGVNNVAGVRERAFGKLAKPEPELTIERRIERLEAAHDMFVEELERRLNGSSDQLLAGFDHTPYLINGTKK